MKVGSLVGVLALVAPASAQEPPPEPPLKPFQPTRTWAFSRYLADGTDTGESFSGVGGRLDATEIFTPSLFDLGAPVDGLNIGRVFASPSGATYGVFSQSPTNSLGSVADPSHEIGNKADLEQYMNFRKDAEGATLSFTVTAVKIEAIDRNGRVLAPGECPPTCAAAIEGEVILSVQAYTTAGSPLRSLCRRKELP